MVDKKSIFETKMKQEREAREKELESEKRLRQKTPRKVPNAEKKEIERPVPVKRVSVSEKPVDKEIIISSFPEKEYLKETGLKSTAIVPKEESGMLKHAKATAARREAENNKSEIIFAGVVFADISAQCRSPNIITPCKKVEDDIKNYTGDINSPQPIDCTSDTLYSDSKAFDFSEILRVAGEEEYNSSPTKLLKTDRTPMRSSTMRTHLTDPVPIKAAIDIDVTPVQIEEEEEEEEELSDFAKQIRAKSEALNHQAEKPQCIDDNADYFIKKVKPQKPPRISKSVYTEFPPTYQEFIEAKNEVRIYTTECHTVF